MDETHYIEVPHSQLNARQKEYTRALLSEIRLVVRTIANDPQRRLSDLKLQYRFEGDKEVREVTASEIIEKISEIEAILCPRENPKN